MQNIDQVNLKKVEICNFGTIGHKVTCRNIFNPDLQKKMNWKLNPFSETVTLRQAHRFGVWTRVCTWHGLWHPSSTRLVAENFHTLLYSTRNFLKTWNNRKRVLVKEICNHFPLLNELGYFQPLFVQPWFPKIALLLLLSHLQWRWRRAGVWTRVCTWHRLWHPSSWG